MKRKPANHDAKEKEKKTFNKKKKSRKPKRNYDNSNEGGKTFIGLAYWLEKVKGGLFIPWISSSRA